MWIALMAVLFLMTNHHVFDNMNEQTLLSFFGESKGTGPIRRVEITASSYIQSRN